MVCTFHEGLCYNSYENTALNFSIYDECISFYESLMKNSYFENDWYPYKQLCNVYKKTEDYEAILKTVNQLLMSGIYLNDFQYLWFTDRIRIIIAEIHHEIFVAANP